MIRWLVIALFIYLMIRLISGPRGKRSRTSGFTFRFRQPDREGQSPGTPRRTRFDQVEEAEFEDITENEQSETERKT